MTNTLVDMIERAEDGIYLLVAGLLATAILVWRRSGIRATPDQIWAAATRDRQSRLRIT